MSFQSAVNQFQGLGVPGEMFDNSPRVARSYILNSADAAYNVFGRGFSITSQGIANAGNTAGTQIFAGILGNPKGSASYGSASGTLAPSLVLPDYAQGELVTEGSMIVLLPANAALGDLVCYDNITGILTTIAPGANLAVGTSFAFATVTYYTVVFATSPYAVITLQPTLKIPVLA